MKKDIPFRKVEQVGIAVVRETLETGATEWNVYLLNLRQEPILQVLVSSSGFGKINGRQRKTSVLRQALGDIPPRTFIKLEMIPEELFSFSNEFLVSFWQGHHLYDRKYVFVPGSISEKFLTEIPLIGKEGILIL